MPEDPRNIDRQNSLLTKGQRKYLMGDKSGYSYQVQSEHETNIVERLREGLADVTLALEELPAELRDEVFDADTRSQEQSDLQRDLRSVLMFIYLGVDGQPEFGDRLEEAVQNAEVRRSGIDNAMLVEVKFGVEAPTHRPVDEIVDRLEQGELETLERAELYALVRQAERSDALDIETLRETWLERVRLVEGAREFNKRQKQPDVE